jgi:hypothetical protein
VLIYSIADTSISVGGQDIKGLINGTFVEVKEDQTMVLKVLLSSPLMKHLLDNKNDVWVEVYYKGIPLTKGFYDRKAPSYSLGFECPEVSFIFTPVVDGR